MALVRLLLLLAALLRAQDVRPLTILHTNDLHAHLVPNDQGLGGFAQLATAVRQERLHCLACLYLNAGDLVQGTPVSTIYKGEPVYEIANRLGIDVSTPGNHEFDYGAPQMLKLVKMAHYAVVSSNLVDPQGRPVLRPYVILNAGGLRVGVIGVIMDTLVAKYIRQEWIGMWHTEPVVETVRRYAAEIGGRADIIVALAHIENAETAALLREAPQVAVVVQGHEHSGYDRLLNVDGRLAVQLKSYGVELGRLELGVDIRQHKAVSSTWKRIPVESAKYQPDKETAKLVAHWESKVSKIVDVKIGASRRRLSGDDVRHLIEQCMKDTTGADLAYVNAGNVRDDLPKGTILARQVWNILPFDNHLVTGKFKGRELPPPVRQENVIDADKEYTLTVIDFSAANQAAELGTTGLAFDKIGPLHRDACIEWVKKRGVIE